MLDSQYYTECITISISVLMKHNEWRQQSHLQALKNLEKFLKLLSMVLSSEKQGDNGLNTSFNAQI